MKDWNSQKMDPEKVFIDLHIELRDCNGDRFITFLFSVGWVEEFGSISQRIQEKMLEPEKPQKFQFMKMMYHSGGPLVKEQDTPRKLNLRDNSRIRAQSQYFLVDRLDRYKYENHLM